MAKTKGQTLIEDLVEAIASAGERLVQEVMGAARPQLQPIPVRAKDAQRGKARNLPR